MDNTDNIPETLKRRILDYGDELLKRKAGEDTAKVTTLRNEALEHFSQNGFPTRKMEPWRNSKIIENLSESYQLYEELPSHDRKAFCCVIQDFDTEVITMYNGRLADDNILRTLDNGIIIGSSRAAMIQHPDLFDKYFGSCRTDEDNGFYDINTALWQDGFFIFVPANVTAEKPVQIIKLIDNVNNPLIQTRNLIILEENSNLCIVDCDDTMSNNASLVNSFTETVIGENAHLETYKLQNLNNETVFINSNTTKQLKDSSLMSCIISFNGGMIRNNVHVDLDGQGADTQVYGLYLMDKKQHIDNQIRVNHNVPDCNSNERFKGILDDEATAVFNGHVYVAPDAQHTNAYQNNSNIILTSSAKVNTMPFLEIYADDVKCSHGSTIGQLDEEAMFYMRQRGISKANARMLLMYAFAAEISNNIKIDKLQERIDDMIKRRLKGELSSCDTCVFQCNMPKEYNFEIDLSKI